MAKPGSSAQTHETTDTRHETKRPPLYRVLMHNDHYTTMAFVVAMLRGVFNKSPEDAVRIMLSVHHNGVGACGVYPMEVAETKIATVHSHAQDKGFPLKCSMEPE